MNEVLTVFGIVSLVAAYFVVAMLLARQLGAWDHEKDEKDNHVMAACVAIAWPLFVLFCGFYVAAMVVYLPLKWAYGVGVDGTEEK